MASLIRRGSVYYAQYYQGRKQKRVCLDTESLQIAKEKIRQIETSLSKGSEIPLATKTAIRDVVAAYAEYLRSVKLERNAQRDIYYLREAFGPICPQIQLKNPKISEKGKKCPTRHAPKPILANHFEQITTSDIAQHIAAQVRAKALAPKTANRFREVLTRLFNWAMAQHGVKMPDNINPAAKVERYREKAPEISFLSMEQIDQQLEALKDQPQLQALVAMYIYAGLRREEALWLTTEDVDLTAGGNGMIRIRAKTVGEDYWQPKTGINRVVPISRSLRIYLESHQPKDVPGGWYFSTPTGKRWNPDNFSECLRETNKAAKICWTCLDYRHTFGSQLAMKGESLYKISKLLGNSPDICRKHYAALIPEAMADSVEFFK